MTGKWAKKRRIRAYVPVEVAADIDAHFAARPGQKRVYVLGEWIEAELRARS